MLDHADQLADHGLEPIPQPEYVRFIDGVLKWQHGSRSLETPLTMSQASRLMEDLAAHFRKRIQAG